ncbi:recombination regulator RecX [Comamonas jiangduensis]|uniref:recombination regulator RecX n=1 Tax=Comamonas jiangduensis TaxID=1194168 RepID=UPI0024E05618|nr:recombination regulator RecX [Comamonas jiangduensis]
MGFHKLSLTGRALKLLSQREHSRLELERKLAPHVEEGEDLGAVLDALEAKNFINPERVAQSVLYRRSSKLGTSRVLQELRSKGLDDDTVRAAAEQLKDTEHARAWEVWLRKFGEVPTTPQERMKQMRFLASRGFGGEVVNKVVRGQAPQAD